MFNPTMPKLCECFNPRTTRSGECLDTGMSSFCECLNPGNSLAKACLGLVMCPIPDYQGDLLESQNFEVW